MILLGLITCLYGSVSSLSLNSYKLEVNIQNRYVVSLGSMEIISVLKRGVPYSYHHSTPVRTVIYIIPYQ